MNQCVCRVSGILLMVVIYTAFTVEGIVFGGDCSGGGSCDGDNTECDGSNECACISTAYRKSDASACDLIVTTLTGTCDIADTATEQCSYANTECTADGGGGKCLCKDTHYSDGTDCQTRITYESACSNTVADTTQCAVTNQECSLESGTSNYKCQCTADYYGDGTGCAAKIAFGVDCSGGKECAGDNTACPSSGTLVCGCAATYYRKSDDSACALIVPDLSGTCDVADTAPEQCSKADTECTADGGGGKCLCKDTHFSDGTDCQTIKTYNQACSNTVTDTKQCGEANQECLLESGTSNYKCQCSAAYYDNGSGCTARITPGNSCSANQCVEHATCDTNCICEAGYTASPTTNPTMCSGVVKFASLSYMYVVPILVSMMSLLR